MKDGVVLYFAYPVFPFSFPFEFVLQELRKSDEGKYTCFLEVLLRNIVKYNVTDSTLIKVKGL